MVVFSGSLKIQTDEAIVRIFIHRKCHANIQYGVETRGFSLFSRYEHDDIILLRVCRVCVSVLVVEPAALWQEADAAACVPVCVFVWMFPTAVLLPEECVDPFFGEFLRWQPDTNLIYSPTQVQTDHSNCVTLVGEKKCRLKKWQLFLFGNPDIPMRLENLRQTQLYHQTITQPTTFEEPGR